MENKKNRIIQVLIIGLLILIIALFTGIIIQKNLDDPDRCSLCHEMKPFVLSYLEPVNGSVINKHDLKCLDCHSNTSIKYAKSALIDEIKGYAVHKITGLNLNIDLSALSVNCKKCHSLDSFRHFNVQNEASCSDCHWAHKPYNKNVNKFNIKNNDIIIPYGPHKNQSCPNCHGTTFEIPKCTQCHKGHYETKPDNSLCLGCHVDPHVPIIPIGISPTITNQLPENLPFDACKPCHEKQFYELNNSFTLHTEMKTCTLCHKWHGVIPTCTSCHTAMNVSKHRDLKCSICHRVETKLPSCQACHGVSHEWSGFSASTSPSS
ncbi:MAG: hypothetical protein PHH85_05215 [Candidatus Methanoperedens sp.]|nr:hypothetical protein [Candidatus Methanoperedens sp.]